MAGSNQTSSLKGVDLPESLLREIRAAAATIHHGQIIIHLNRENPRSVDVEIRTRERFSVE